MSDRGPADGSWSTSARMVARIAALVGRVDEVLAVPMPRSILIVEDEPIPAELMAHWLSSIPGIDISVATTLASADKVLAANAVPSVVVIDLNLPDGSGDTLALRLPRSVTVILVSAAIDDERLSRLAVRTGTLVCDKADRAGLVRLVASALDAR